MSTEKGKIAKNTLYLYGRMLISMGITFYTSRIILLNLGVEKFGVYSIVGGIAVLFSFLNNSLASSTQRYLTFAIGQKNTQQIAKVFSVAVITHISIAGFIFTISEIVGLWLIWHKLDIPEYSLSSAVIVFQCSLLSCATSIINVPYTAAVIAEEKFNFFAIIGLAETILRLVVAYLIVLFPNRLVSYALLLYVVVLLVFITTRVYCRLKFVSIRFDIRNCNLKLCREMVAFTGWHMLRNGAMMAVTQGNNVLVNMFGGPIASAAMGILTQLSSGVTRFMTSVQTAFSPQITKNYSDNEISGSVHLMITSTKISAILFFFIGIPLVLNMDFVLSIWLKQVPEYADIFCKYGLLCVYFETLSVPIDTLIMAVGKIKRYEQLSAIIWGASVVVAYFALKIGLKFEYILIFRACAGIIYIYYEGCVLRDQIQLNINRYLMDGLLRPTVIGIICIGVVQILCNESLTGSTYFLGSSIFSSLFLIVCTWLFILNRDERYMLQVQLKRVVSNLLK